MFYRLGIDIGETSIGWFILQLDKNWKSAILLTEVCIFSGRQRSQVPRAVICFPPYGARNPA